MKKQQAIFQLLLATLLWGFGFVATVWAIRSYTPAEALTYRFFMAGLLGVIIQALFFRESALVYWPEVTSSFPAGLMLGLMQLTQTIGLQTTTATKSGFITSLYVILVPLLGMILIGIKSSLKTYVLSLMALCGTYLLMGASFNSFVVGDLWTLVCAVLAAAHIIYIGKISKTVENAFRFNTYQSLWAFCVMLPLLLSQSEIKLVTSDEISVLGVLILCFGSSLLAFFLQIKAQKYLSNNMTTMLSLLESPIAALFGFMILGETLLGGQMIGAALILASSVVSVLLGLQRKM